MDYDDESNDGDFEDYGFDDHDDVGFQFEHDSAMDSIGWGDDDGGDLAPAWDVL